MTMLVCMAIAMFSCSKDEEEEISFAKDDLVGTWTISTAEIKVIGMGDDMDIKTYPENSVLLFSSDNTYEIKTEAAGATYQEGSWKLEEKNVILTDKITKIGKSYEIKVLTKEESTLYYKQTTKVGDSEMGHEETVILKK